MSLLITGSSGFIGTNLILFFKKKIKFFCIDKVKNRYIKDKNFFQLNLKNKSKLEKYLKKKKKYIIHLVHCLDLLTVIKTQQKLLRTIYLQHLI